MSQTCPVWIGYLLASPGRKLFQDPTEILSPYVKAGMTVMDVGCAMGFFTIPAAQLVGENGRVIAVDLQEAMFKNLKKRAAKARVLERIETHTCSATDLMVNDLYGQVDVALAIAMVHEAESPKLLLEQIAAAVKPGGTLLIAEPTGHVTAAQIEETKNVTLGIGFSIEASSRSKRLHSFVLKKAA